MRMISVYNEAGIAKVNIEDWTGKNYKERRYQPSGASLDRLADVVNHAQLHGLIRVRPFLGGCVGYVAVEGKI